ncbi:hypothetical protein ACFQ07_07965, partial [Actinomadura adrarensis]
MVAETASSTSESFFLHVPVRESAADRPLQDDTRYLAAAMYLDRHLCDQVIDEYVRDEHRAVPPSFGFDLDPVIRHALR